ncbi:MAG TPA: PhoX family phosphatase [Acidimicrobiales bacterium]|nr:PhoX family phosphatase [Acidimicrobiales bacterium]
MHLEHSEGVNPSDNGSLADLIPSRLSRRHVLGGGLAAAAFTMIPATAARATTTIDGGEVDELDAASNGRHRKLLGFDSVPASSKDKLIVADGYVAELLIPWGTPLLSTGPAWKEDASNTAEEQAQQIGAHHDGIHFFPWGNSKERSRRGLLAVNHEYIDQILHYTDGSAVMTKEKVDKALAAHGVSVVEVALSRGKWRLVDSEYNRRITGATPMAFSGPVSAEHPQLQSNNPPLGTLNNCAHGFTPWGTYLTGEENWHGYFGATDTFTATPDEARYGLSATGFGYKWHVGDPVRFDLNSNRKEPNRFGWVVEIDPFDPSSTPVKRTALGRIKHEGATVVESDGRVVVYTGDDEDKEYLYKFISADKWKKLRREGKSPLDHGELYVAKFDANGSGHWLPLVHGQGPLTIANGWADPADVLLRTRQAADAVGATKLDRPEWVAANPKRNDVYLALTNGTSGSPGISPRNPNPYGHIVHIVEAKHDNTALEFMWDIFVLAGDLAYDSAVNINGDIYGSPDGLWIDDDGRLWIQTDVSNSSQNRPERGYDNIANNAMLAADPATGETRRFLVGPRGCEITGVITTPDQQTMFVNVQHPGESTTFWGTPTPENPRLVSNWPDFEQGGRPRSATVVIRKIGGGKIGS